MPLLFAAEAGVPAGIATLALLSALGVRAVRARGARALVYVSLALFFVFDDFPITHDEGIVAAGLRLG